MNLKTFVAYYFQKTKRGEKEKTMEIKAKNRTEVFVKAKQSLPRHSWLGNVYLKNGEFHKLVKAGLL